MHCRLCRAASHALPGASCACPSDKVSFAVVTMRLRIAHWTTDSTASTLVLRCLQSATDAAAADAERAVQLLLDGLPCSGAPPIDLSRCVGLGCWRRVVDACAHC